MTDPRAALQRLAGWFTGEALPLWAARGYDEAGGGFFECLDFAGAPVRPASRRVRVQARQIHVFATAARRGWHPDAERIAQAGFAYFTGKACPDGGRRGCVHLLSPDGGILDDRRDLYDQAFLLLACASYWRAFRDDAALDLAAAAAAFLETELRAPEGGYLEDDRGSAPRRQNPHMHLFEAFLALHLATGERAWRDKASAIFDLFAGRFFDQERGVLREFFTDDLKRLPGGKGDVIEPGHMAEWTALLDRFGAASDARIADLMRRLYEGAVRTGRDPASGFLVDRTSVGEAPGGARRLWPQTEYAKACLVVARRGDDSAFARAGDLITALFQSYLNQPVRGLWCDQYNGEGEPIARDVPASILYHIMELTIEAIAVIEARDAGR